MVYPLIIRAAGTYILKKTAKKQLKKDLAQAKRTPEKKLKNTANLHNVDRFTKIGKKKDKVLRGSSKKTNSFKTQSPYSGLTSTTKKQQAPNVLGPAGTYKSPTKRFNTKDMNRAVRNARTSFKIKKKQDY